MVKWLAGAQGVFVFMGTSSHSAAVRDTRPSIYTPVCCQVPTHSIKVKHINCLFRAIFGHFIAD